MEGKLSFSEAIRDEEILTCNDVKIQEDPESSIKIIVRNFHIKFSRAFEEEVGPANCPDLGAGGILVTRKRRTRVFPQVAVATPALQIEGGVDLDLAPICTNLSVLGLKSIMCSKRCMVWSIFARTAHRESLYITSPIVCIAKSRLPFYGLIQGITEC